jgi:hypothetical protein
MSDKPTHRELGWAIRDLTDNALCHVKRVLLYTSLQCINAQFKFNWSYESLANSSGLKRRSATKHMSELINLGYILIIKRGGGGRNTPHEMQLNYKKILSNSSHKSVHGMHTKGQISVHQTTNKRACGAQEASVEAKEQEHSPFVGGDAPLKEKSKETPAEFKARLKQMFG